jgi:putative transposase
MIELLLEYKGKSYLSANRMCKALNLSRSVLYRGSVTCNDDMGLRDEIQRIALEMTFYGYRRITSELRRRGWRVNHKRVLRMMREDNLLCLRKKKFVAVNRAEKNPTVYPNLAREIIVDDVNRLWVSDMTYIRLRKEFIYLAVVLDVYSRKCVGWSLGRRLNERLALTALEMALEDRQIGAGLIHHSDRGLQYTSKVYTERLKAEGIRISMSRSGNPYDNAYAESFIKTLKYDEVYLWEYESINDARERIGYFIESVYNTKRLHSAIGYMPPAEYEQMWQKEVVLT